jgi:hypothetical protein
MKTDSANLAEIEWECRSLIYSTWEPRKTWVSLSYQSQYVYPLARQALWEEYEAQVRAEILRWQALGWEPAEPISSSGLVLLCREYTEQRIGASDVVLWIATLGLALLVTILLGGNTRYYVAFEPLEYHILMHRPVVNPEGDPPGL